MSIMLKQIGLFLMSSLVKGKVLGVPVEDLPLWWDKAKVLVEKAIPYTDGKTDINQVKKDLLEREMQLWIYVNEHGTIQLASITRIVVYLHKKKRLEIVFFSGDGSCDIVSAFQRVFESFGRSSGCEALEGIGRNGWTRRMKKYDYELIHSVVRKWL